MENATINLLTCSRCKCQMMKNFFGLHPRTHQRYKCCESCRSQISHKRKANKKTIKCSYDGCNKKFATKCSLSVHIKNIHENISKKMACSNAIYF